MSAFDANKRWAGQFDCEAGTCRRKRLTASEFSRKALDNHRKTGKPLKCRQCVEAEARKEQEAAAATVNAATAASTASAKLSDASEVGAAAVAASLLQLEGADTVMYRCGSCHQSLPHDSFNRNQLQKGAEKQRCRSCVQAAEQHEAARVSAAKPERIAAARAAVATAEASGSAAEILRATAALAALEAEAVTGIKPKVLMTHGNRRDRSSGGNSNSNSNSRMHTAAHDGGGGGSGSKK